MSDQKSNFASQRPQTSILQKHTVPEEKRKKNGRVNGSPINNSLKLAVPEEKTEEHRKCKRKPSNVLVRTQVPEEKRKKNGRVNGRK